MLTKTVKVGDQEVTFKSSAAIPRMYRIKFKRDIFKDLTKLEKSYKEKDDGTKELEIEDLEIFENVAYIMALHADPSTPDQRGIFYDKSEVWIPDERLYEVLYTMEVLSDE